MTSIEGKIVVVTGSTTGIGLQLAKDFRAQGAIVVLTCRDATKGRQATEALQTIETSQPIHLLTLDLMSYDSILEFCSELAATVDHVDYLVCNAGIMGHAFELSADGIESHFATNCFGHFVIVNRLLRLLENCGGRIVLVSSGLYKQASTIPSLRQLMGEDNWDYDAKYAYALSKLSMNLHTVELNRRLRASQSKVTVVAVRPGFIRGTELGRETNWFLRKLASPLIFFFSKNLKTGADVVYKATVLPPDEVQSGRLYCDGPEDYNEMVSESNAKHMWDLMYQMEGLVLKRSKLPDDILQDARNFHEHLAVATF